MKWSAPPAGTRELAVYLGRLRYDRETEPSKLKVPFGILIINIAPSERGIRTNTFPPRSGPVAFRVRNSCPAAKGQRVLVQLFALDRPLQLSGLQLSEEAVVDLTEYALGNTKSRPTSRWVRQLTEEALASARFVAIYAP